MRPAESTLRITKASQHHGQLGAKCSTDGHEYIFTLHLNEMFCSFFFLNYRTPYDKGNSIKSSNYTTINDKRPVTPNEVCVLWLKLVRNDIFHKMWSSTSIIIAFTVPYRNLLHLGFRIAFNLLLSPVGQLLPSVRVYDQEVWINWNSNCFQKPSSLMSQIKCSLENILS